MVAAHRLGGRVAIVAAVASCMAATMAMAIEPITADLEQRLRQQGVDAVNAYLAEQAYDLALLHRDTEGCVAPAIGLTVALSRGSRSKTTQAHTDSLRTALGRCTGLVLSQLTLAEVPKVCASVASWTLMQTVRELRHRMRVIAADETLRTSPRGKACSDACLHELKTTRVGLRAGSPGARPR